jgi:hypothetical protein
VTGEPVAHALGGLADRGVLHGLTVDLGRLGDACWDHMEQDCAPRYAPVARALWRLDAWWSEYSLVPYARLAAIDEELRRGLRTVLAAADEADALSAASVMRRRIDAITTSSDTRLGPDPERAPG